MVLYLFPPLSFRLIFLVYINIYNYRLILLNINNKLLIHIYLFSPLQPLNNTRIFLR